MPQKNGLDVLYRDFNMPLSYRIGERGLKLRDCSNVYSAQGILNTRFGMSRFTSSALGGPILSMTEYIENDGTRHRLVKVGTTLYDIADDGSSSSVKTGLTSTTKHRGITINDRHIIAIESDGLFQWDGTTFTQLGNAVPGAVTIAKDEGAGDITAGNWQVAVTFYDSGVGFETNIGTASSVLALDGGNDGINVSAIPSSADSAFIDKVRVYLKDSTNAGDWLFVEELDLGTTTTDIDTETLSTQTPPTTHQIHPGNAKYLTEFNGSLVTAGDSTYPSDLFVSAQFYPQGFDDTASGLYGEGARHNLLGDGPITGIARGLFKGDSPQPYIVILKETSTHMYSDGGGLVLLNENIGGYHDTTFVKNGDVYFMSNMGFYRIQNGSFQVDENGDPITLGNGDIDDIFKDESFDNSLNKAQFSNFFSVGYNTLGQYITFCSGGGSTSRDIAYVYEFEVGGFKRYNMPWDVKFAKTMKDENGKEVVFLGDLNGHLYTHSINENRTDVTLANAAKNIPAFAQLIWMEPEPIYNSNNWRELVLTAINSSNAITVKGFVNYDLTQLTNYSFDMSSSIAGFTLDISRLDLDILADARAPTQQHGDILKTGRNLLLGFYQEIANANLGLINAQVTFSRNGNSN